MLKYVTTLLPTRVEASSMWRHILPTRVEASSTVADGKPKALTFPTKVSFSTFKVSACKGACPDKVWLDYIMQSNLPFWASQNFSWQTVPITLLAFLHFGILRSQFSTTQGQTTTRQQNCQKYVDQFVYPVLPAWLVLCECTQTLCLWCYIIIVGVVQYVYRT